MLKYTTYYLRDAQGNVLSTYKHEVNDTLSTVDYLLTERNIYGSARLGMLKSCLDMLQPVPMPSYGRLGYRNYELTDHIGNVNVVLSDKIIPVPNGMGGVAYYYVNVISYANYCLVLK